MMWSACPEKRTVQVCGFTVPEAIRACRLNWVVSYPPASDNLLHFRRPTHSRVGERAAGEICASAEAPTVPAPSGLGISLP